MCLEDVIEPHTQCRKAAGSEYADPVPPIYRELAPIVPANFGPGPFVTILPGQSNDCGIGKSTTAAELLIRTAVETNTIPAWVNCAELMMEIRATFGERSKQTEADIVRQYVRKPLLCIDDLAAEKTSDFSVSTLYVILNQRGEQDRRTIITSNLTLKDLAQTLGDRIANRLARYGVVITLTKNNVLQVG